MRKIPNVFISLNLCLKETRLTCVSAGFALLGTLPLKGLIMECRAFSRLLGVD